jgi:hypothetical protein
MAISVAPGSKDTEAFSRPQLDFRATQDQVLLFGTVEQ